MLNGDVLTDLDLSAQIAQHEATGATGTLALVPVAGPVELRPRAPARRRRRSRSSSRSRRPDAVLDTNLISAGAYVLERSVLDLIAARPQRLDRARGLAARSSTTASTATSTTRPTGSTSARPSATCRRRSTSSRATSAPTSWRSSATATSRSIRRRGSTGARCRPRSSAPARRSPRGAHVGSLAVLGDDVAVGAGSIVERAVVLAARRSASDCVLRDCIVGPGAAVGDRSQVIGGAMIGEGVMIGADNVIARGARLFPGMEVPDGGLAF